MALLDWARTQRRDLRVLHVNHGWHAQSSHWAAWVQQRCQEMNVPCRVYQLPGNIPHTEVAARDARLAWMAQQLGVGDRLLLGHHQQDQRETAAMRLMRGRPPRGMPVWRRLGSGWLWRPWLDRPKPEWPSAAIDDPANYQSKFERVRVRRWLHDMAPESLAQLDRLISLWSRIEALVQRSIPNDDTLPISQAMHPACIAAWLWARFGLPAPPQARLRSLRDALPPKPDRQPAIEWEAAGRTWQIRAYAERLHLFPVGWSGAMPPGHYPLTGKARKGLHRYRIAPWLRDFVYQDVDGQWVAQSPKIAWGGDISLEEMGLND